MLGIFQALQVSSVDKLDQKLSSMLLEGIPTGGFPGLQCEKTPERGTVLSKYCLPAYLHLLHRKMSHGERWILSMVSCLGPSRTGLIFRFYL